MSPTHTRKGNRLHRYYVGQDVLKRGPDACPVGRVPAAEIVEAILDGRQPKELRLEDLLEVFPADWEGQKLRFA